MLIQETVRNPVGNPAVSKKPNENENEKDIAIYYNGIAGPVPRIV